MTIYRDTRGKEIREGDKVAFNLSGQVAEGEVVGIRPGQRYPFLVHLNHNAAGCPVGHVSRVRSATSILVLDA